MLDKYQAEWLYCSIACILHSLQRLLNGSKVNGLYAISGEAANASHHWSQKA